MALSMRYLNKQQLFNRTANQQLPSLSCKNFVSKGKIFVILQKRWGNLRKPY